MSNEYLPLDGDWMLLSPDPKHAPESLRHRLQAGIPAKVPGEATVDLLRNELIADPFDSDNENTQLWIGRTDWRFERHFEWHDDGRTMHELVAFGLDTIATVSLNGHVVDRTRNCYRSYRWNVNEILHEGDNVLTVDFTAPIDEADRLEHRRGYYPHAERWPFNQIRKTPYSFGWDWGVAVPGAGIWRSIGIESWSGVRIAQVRPLTSLEANGMGELNLYVRIVREDKGRVIDMSSPHDAETTESVALLRNDGALPFALPQVAGDAAPGVAGDVAAPGASAGGAGAAAPGVARGLDAAAGASGCVRAPRRIAVVGPLADDAQAQLGDWAGCSGQVGWMPDGQPRDMIVTVLDGVRDIAGRAGVEVTYARGADLVDLVPDPAGDTYPDGQPRPKVAVPAPADRALIDGAVAAARGADLVVAVVGDVVQLVGEGRSTATLELVGGQNALLEALAGVARRTGKPLVVVLMSSKPLVLPACVVGPAPTAADVRPDGTVPHCRDGEAGGAGAILWVPSPGMQGGRAIAEILFGLCEPTGRLPITFPRHAGQLPVYYNQIRGQHGDRYADLTQDPAFAFGEGLSYTAFEYGEPVVTNVPSGGAFAKDGVVHVEVPLANVGARGGTEVVQLYVGDLVTSYSWTDRELKAFRRVTLAPGERTAVAFDLPVAACTIVDANANRFVEAGEFELLVGHSSRREDLKRTVITVK